MGKAKCINLFHTDQGKIFLEKLKNSNSVNIRSNETLKITNLMFKRLCLYFGHDINSFEYVENFNFNPIIEDIKLKTQEYDDEKWCNLIKELIQKYKYAETYSFHFQHIINYLFDFEKLKIGTLLKKEKQFGEITKLKEDKHLISIEDLDSIFDNSDEIEKIVVGILISTGMRSKGFLNITPDNIDIINNTVKTIEKGNKETLYLLPPKLIKLMTETEFKEKKWNRSSFYRTIKKLENITISKNNIHPHAFRHTFATLLVKNGYDIREIAKLLNHSSEKITEEYYVIENTADVAKRINLPFFKKNFDKENIIPKFWSWLQES